MATGRLLLPWLQVDYSFHGYRPITPSMATGRLLLPWLQVDYSFHGYRSITSSMAKGRLLLPFLSSSTAVCPMAMLSRRRSFSKFLMIKTTNGVFREGAPKFGSLPRRYKSTTTNEPEDSPIQEESNHHFNHHRYVDFYRDESMSIGIVRFRNTINGKKNIFGDFLDELRNVIEHVTNIISNEETNAFYIKEFPQKDNYMVKNLRNRIPYVDNRLKVLILTWDNAKTQGQTTTISSTPDYNSFLKNDEQLNIELSNSFRYLCNTIQHLPLITISTINGQCYNSGMDLLLSTDFKLSSEQSTFGFNKTHLGLFPYGGSTQKLFRTIPMSYAKHLLLTGDTISAKDALRINLIDICMNENEDHFINTSCVHFDTKFTKTQKIEILKKSVLTFFADIFSNELFAHKTNDSSFVFSLFFAFQFFFIPTNSLQSIKMSIMEGMSLSEPNLYLDHDRAVFERNVNAPQRGEILAYLKRTINNPTPTPT
ncbi:enoyl-CoA hydratase, putative [Plasmodium knowlesi strain H]|uniref:Enoyl-CoA hydratase, putative n=3 Tax=Plasmodium knowlesi TaxID=5850 RepID=A0A5K1UUS3_PLAKH|nr:enoyl-CoA hydratase, putative [Plasmodium knowlesi strain H]OTN67843.1 putative Enoyl-CoA hydratase [Plasmodium knowlesi]CAA9990370.1 enoyl-CoA hydratase, putative [Plasmodium knowlesi strain H]SBO19576.1 enoyl-CoA hydratase, putative [Plasmodium knowlesi strain H]SBO22681.1 enoyl-CoA hydratase, putative [Plasmodium knowlesi strain H]VVS79844.1 enoyl-CoA hydratase, putative [Plasmodium knowlesi strain H]|eukprot:XP_002260770.1 Enoyl-CoA hydratase/isomerase, putative [Plasmodium knowlesi strain H]